MSCFIFQALTRASRLFCRERVTSGSCYSEKRGNWEPSLSVEWSRVKLRVIDDLDSGGGENPNSEINFLRSIQAGLFDLENIYMPHRTNTEKKLSSESQLTGGALWDKEPVEGVRRLGSERRERKSAGRMVRVGREEAIVIGGASGGVGVGLLFWVALAAFCLICVVIFSCADGVPKGKTSASDTTAYGTGCSAGCGAGCGA